MLQILREHWAPTGLPGIMHCFSGNQAQAEASLALGFTLSFAGNLTYPKSTTLQTIAASAPADRILVETDAPFLTPIPLRGQTNQPANVVLTAKFLAGLRGITPEAIATQTTANFCTRCSFLHHSRLKPDCKAPPTYGLKHVPFKARFCSTVFQPHNVSRRLNEEKSHGSR